MTDHAELLRRWQCMYNAMDSKHEDKWPKDDDFQKLRQDTHAALAARPVTPTVLVVDGATSLWIDGAKVAQWRRELSTDEVISLIENPWGMFKPASAPKFPTMLRKMWSGGEVQAWINEHWPTTPASAPEAPIAWWNGIRKTGDGFRDMDQPSFAEQEDTNHDIPVFAGFNPCHASAPEALSDAQIDEVFMEWDSHCFGTPITAHRRFARSILALAAPSTPAALTDDQIDATFAKHFSGFVTLEHQRKAAREIVRLAFDHIAGTDKMVAADLVKEKS